MIRKDKKIINSIRKKLDVQDVDIEDEVFVTNGKSTYSLNNTAKVIWQALKKDKVSYDDLFGLMQGMYSGTDVRIKKDLNRFLIYAEKEGLIEIF